MEILEFSVEIKEGEFTQSDNSGGDGTPPTNFRNTMKEAHISVRSATDLENHNDSKPTRSIVVPLTGFNGFNQPPEKFLNYNSKSSTHNYKFYNHNFLLQYLQLFQAENLLIDSLSAQAQAGPSENLSEIESESQNTSSNRLMPLLTATAAAVELMRMKTTGELLLPDHNNIVTSTDSSELPLEERADSSSQESESDNYFLVFDDVTLNNSRGNLEMKRKLGMELYSWFTGYRYDSESATIEADVTKTTTTSKSTLKTIRKFKLYRVITRFTSNYTVNFQQQQQAQNNINDNSTTTSTTTSTTLSPRLLIKFCRTLRGMSPINLLYQIVSSSSESSNCTNGSSDESTKSIHQCLQEVVEYFTQIQVPLQS